MSGILFLQHVQEAREIGMTRGVAIVQQVLLEVSTHSGVPAPLIMARTRLDQPLRARQLVMRAAYDLGASVEDIATVLRRDRSSVLEALNSGDVTAAARRTRQMPARTHPVPRFDRESWLRPFLRHGQPASLTSADYANRAGGISMSISCQRLSALLNEGLIQKTKSSRTPVYELTASGQEAVQA